MQPSSSACGFGDGQHAATIRRQSPERGIVVALDAAFAARVLAAARERGLGTELPL